MIGKIVAVLVGIILIVGVAVPLTTSVVTTANLTGIPATIVGFLATFLAMASLVLVVALMGR